MPDLVSIFVNLSNSLGPVQKLVSGLAYVLGISLFLAALLKFHKIGDARARSNSQEKMFIPILYVFLGAALIFLPSSLDTLAATAFGNANILAYSTDSGDPLINAVKMLIRTTGLIWCVRGMVLLAQASEPGVQEGPKGLAFLVAGVFAFNFDNTVDAINYSLEMFFAFMDSLKQNATG